MFSCVFWCEFVDLLNLLTLFGSFSKSTVLVGNHVNWRFRILRKLYLKATLGLKKKNLDDALIYFINLKTH